MPDTPFKSQFILQLKKLLERTRGNSVLWLEAGSHGYCVKLDGTTEIWLFANPEDGWARATLKRNGAELLQVYGGRDEDDDPAVIDLLETLFREAKRSCEEHRLNELGINEALQTVGQALDAPRIGIKDMNEDIPF